jgi:hypothetical protein
VAVVLAILELVLVEAGVDTGAFVVVLVASTGLLPVVVDELLLKENNPGAVAGVAVVVEGVVVVVVVEDVAGLAPKENDGVAEVLDVLGTLACPNKPVEEVVVAGADVVVVEATGVVVEATAVLPKRPPLVGAVAGEPNNWVCGCG